MILSNISATATTFDRSGRRSDRMPSGTWIGFPIGNLAEYPFKKVPQQFRERRFIPPVFFLRNNDRRSDMKKISCVLAALATIAVAAPTVASAEGFSFRIGSDRDYYRDDYRSPRVAFYGHDRGWHRGWYHDGDRVIIRRHHYWDDY
jgi:hypothetical protein